MGEVTGKAADRAEALCGEVQRLLVGLGVMPAPKPKRRHWLLVAGALVLAAVAVVVTRESRLAR